MMTQIASVSTTCFRRLCAAIAVLGLGASATWAQRVDNPYAFTTLAGSRSISGFANGTGTAAQFSIS